MTNNPAHVLRKMFMNKRFDILGFLATLSSHRKPSPILSNSTPVVDTADGAAPSSSAVACVVVNSGTRNVRTDN